MAVTHRTVVALPGAALLYGIIIVERQGTTDDKDDLRVAGMCMQAARCPRTEGRIHNLHMVVDIVARVEMTFATFEARQMSLWDLLKIYDHCSSYF